jgi:hypothetical protein
MFWEVENMVITTVASIVVCGFLLYVASMLLLKKKPKNKVRN